MEWWHWSEPGQTGRCRCSSWSFHDPAQYNSKNYGSLMFYFYLFNHISRRWAHKVEAAPKFVNMMRILDKNKNHHPFNQVLHWGLVAAKSSFKDVVQQSGNKILQAQTQVLFWNLFVSEKLSVNIFLTHLFEFGKQQQQCLPCSVFDPMLQGVTIVTDFGLWYETVLWREMVWTALAELVHAFMVQINQ